MSREFTKREKLLLVIMSTLLIAILYFQFVYKPAKESISKYDTEKIEIELMTEQAKALGIKTMKSEMEINKSESLGTVESYNNIKNEISALNDIFSAADTFNIEFAEPVQDGDAVRRNIEITFTAGNYSEAEAIVGNLYKCKYRCLIRTVNIAASESSVKGTLQVTFFETMYNATTTDGLVKATATEE